MDCSVSGLLKVFSPHHAMVGRECAKKEEKKSNHHSNTDYYCNKWNNVENKNISDRNPANRLCPFEEAFLFSFFFNGLCCPPFGVT